MKSGFELIRPKLKTTFGSADWLNWRELQNENLDTFKDRPWLGILPYSTSAGAQFSHLYANQNGHIFTLGATRSGKGTTQIIPNLLHWPFSTVVIDVKGENYDLTQERRRSFGPVYHFAPYRNESYSFNPLDFISDGVTEDDQEERARYLSELLIPLNKKATDPYWDNAARSLVRSFILWVATTDVIVRDKDHQKEIPFNPRTRTMSEVVRLVKQDKENFELSLEAMQEEGQHQWCIGDAPSIKRLLQAEKQFVGVIEIVVQNLNVWASGRLKKITEKTNIPFSKFRTEPSSLYLMIPPDEMEEYRGVFRAITGVSIKVLKDEYNDDHHRDWPPVLFMLDEFTQLGRMEPILHGLNYLAGYGICLWTFVQNLAAFKDVYPKDWQSFIANSPTRCFFGVNDYETAKLVSDMVGITTIQNNTRTHNTGTSESFGTSSGKGWSSGPNGGSSSSNSGSNHSVSYSSGSSHATTDAKRALYNADEVMRLGQYEQIIFMQGLKPIKATRIPYFGVSEWNELVGSWQGERGDIKKGADKTTVTPPAMMKRATFEEGLFQPKKAEQQAIPRNFLDNDDWSL